MFRANTEKDRNLPYQSLRRSAPRQAKNHLTTKTGVRGSRLGDIKKVISQIKAIEQCDGYISSHGYEVIVAENTAMAAREVARKQSMSVAAIASLETAAIYGLKVLDEHINEKDDNHTDFVVVSR